MSSKSAKFLFSRWHQVFYRFCSENRDFVLLDDKRASIQKQMNFFPLIRHEEHKIVCFFKIQQPIEALPLLILPLKLVSSRPSLYSKNAIKKKCDNKNSFLGLICFHMVKMVQKSAIPTLLHFIPVCIEIWFFNCSSKIRFHEKKRKKWQ